jgi:SAM-dependent methyltransferase
MTKATTETTTYGQLSAEYFNLVKPKALSEEIHFYQQVLSSSKGSILYAMCGSGRLMLPLLSKGYDIEGLDYSLPMLERCREEGRARGLKPILHEQSISDMFLEKKYDIILIIGGSFQLIYPRESAIRTLRAAKNHLVQGGKLFIDTFIPWELLYENGQEENFVNEVQFNDGKSLKIETYSLANKMEQYFVSHNQYKKIENNKVIQIEKEEMSVLWYYHYEMILLLESVGFRKVHVHDNKIGKHPALTIYEALN